MSWPERCKWVPLNCCKCGRFLGRDGYPDALPGDTEYGYPTCGPCGRAQWIEARGHVATKVQAVILATMGEQQDDPPASTGKH